MTIQNSHIVEGTRKTIRFYAHGISHDREIVMASADEVSAVEKKLMVAKGAPTGSSFLWRQNGAIISDKQFYEVSNDSEEITLTVSHNGQDYTITVPVPSIRAHIYSGEEVEINIDGTTVNTIVTEDPPQLSSTFSEGDILVATVEEGTVTAYVWKRDNVVLSGANTRHYTLTNKDLNTTVSVEMAYEGGSVTKSVYTDTGNDSTSPNLVLLGSKDITIEAGSQYSELGATAIDTMDGDLTSQIQISGTVDPSTPGTYEVTYTVTDAAGNTATKKRTVTVEDTTKPILSLKGQSTISVDFGSTYVDEGATAIDTMDGDITSRIQVSGSVDTSTPGTYELIYAVSDAAGNEATTVKRTVTVNEEKLIPSIQLIGDESITIGVGLAYEENGATATDSGGNNLTASIQVSGTVNTSVPGTYTLLYTITTAAGLSASASRTVIVKDLTKPTLTLVGDATIKIAVGSTYEDEGATATDNIDGDITSRIQVSGSVDTSTPGTYELIYTVSDAAGNEATTERRTVIVEDRTPPELSLNGSPTVTIEAGSSYTDLGATAIDNVGGNLTGAIVVSGKVDAYKTGTYTLTYTVRDAAGNEAASITRTVTVVDSVLPFIELIGAPVMTLEKGSAYTERGAKASDNADGIITNNIDVTGSVNVNEVGEYTLTYTISDSSGNEASVQRTVNIIEKVPISLEIFPQKVTVEKASSLASVLNLLTLSYNRNFTVTNNWDQHEQRLNATGTFSVDYTVTDGDRSATETLTIAVIDTVPPVVTITPSELTVEKGTPIANVKSQVTVSTTEGTVDKGNWSSILSNTDKVGTYYVEYTASDGTNEAVERLKIIVEDNTAPEIFIRDENGVEITELTVNVGERLNEIKRKVTVSSNDGTRVNAGWSSIVFEKGQAKGGEYTVQFIATDSSGNRTEKNLAVVVDDNVAPSLTLEKTLLVIERGTLLSEVQKPTASSDESFAIADTWDQITQDNLDTVGEYTVTYSVEDDANNRSTEELVVRVVDTTPPTLSLSVDSIVIEVGETPEKPTVTSDTANVTDDWSKLDNTKEGVQTFTFVATDAAGLTTTRRVTVTVRDTESEFANVRFTPAATPQYFKVYNNSDLRAETGEYSGGTMLRLGTIDNIPSGVETLTLSNTDKFSLDGNTLYFTGTEQVPATYSETLTLKKNGKEFTLSLPILTIVEDKEHSFEIEFPPRQQLSANTRWDYPITITDEPLEMDVTAMSQRTIRLKDGAILETTQSVNKPFSISEVGIYEIVYSAPDINGENVEKVFEWTVWSASWPTITPVSDEFVYSATFSISDFVSITDDGNKFKGTLFATWTKNGVQFAETSTTTFTNISSLSASIAEPTSSGDAYTIRFVYEERKSGDRHNYDEVQFTVFPTAEWQHSNGVAVGALDSSFYTSKSLISGGYTPQELFDSGRIPDQLILALSAPSTQDPRVYKFVHNMTVTLDAVNVRYSGSEASDYIDVSVGADDYSAEWKRGSILMGTGASLQLTKSTAISVTLKAFGVSATQEFEADNVAGLFTYNIEGLNEPGGQVAMVESIRNLDRNFINQNYDEAFAWTDQNNNAIAQTKKYRIVSGITALKSTVTLTEKRNTTTVNGDLVYLGRFTVEDSVDVEQVSERAAVNQAKRSVETVNTEQQAGETEEETKTRVEQSLNTSLKEVLLNNIKRRRDITEDQTATAEIEYRDEDGNVTTEQVAKASDEVIYELNKAALRSALKVVREQAPEAKIQMKTNDFLTPDKEEKLAVKLGVSIASLREKDVEIIGTIDPEDISEEEVEAQAIEGETQQETKKRIAKVQAKTQAKKADVSNTFVPLAKNSVTAIKFEKPQQQQPDAPLPEEKTVTVELSEDNTYTIEAESQSGQKVTIPNLAKPEGETEASVYVNIGGEIVDISLLSILFSGTTYATEVPDVVQSQTTARVNYTGNDPAGRELVLYPQTTTSTATITVEKDPQSPAGGSGEYLFNIAATGGALGPNGVAVFELKVPGQDTVGDPLLTNAIPVHVGPTLETLDNSCSVASVEYKLGTGAYAALDQNTEIPLNNDDSYPLLTLRVSAESNSEFPTLETTSNALAVIGQPTYSVSAAGKGVTTREYTWQPMVGNSSKQFSFAASTVHNGSSSLTTSTLSLEEVTYDILLSVEPVTITVYKGNSFTLSATATHSNAALQNWNPTIELSSNANISSSFSDVDSVEADLVKRVRTFTVIPTSTFVGSLALSVTLGDLSQQVNVTIEETDDEPDNVTLNISAPYDGVVKNLPFIVVTTGRNPDTTLPWAPDIVMGELQKATISALPPTDTTTTDYHQRVQQFIVTPNAEFTGNLTMQITMGSITRQITILVRHIAATASASADPFFVPFF